MRIVDAMTLRDGGTTCVSIDDGQDVQHVTFDYSLPWDGRTRYLYFSNKPFVCEDQFKLEPESYKERELIQAIHSAAITEFGVSVVEAFFLDPRINPGQSMWFYVFNFLSIAAVERGLGRT
jgi:hypothetical protein